MKIIFLGQAGLLLQTNNTVILIDPYLSDSVKDIQPAKYRRQRINEYYLNIKPDILIITHCHADHYDKETLKHYFEKDNEIMVLCPSSVWSDIYKNGENHNYILFDAETSVTINGISFYSVKAVHSDEWAIGVVISEKENYYITGDTLYSEKVFNSLPKKKYKAVFLPINGKGNNMNVADAKRFAKRVDAEFAVPIHFGMFDNMTGKEFDADNSAIPNIYEEIIFK